MNMEEDLSTYCIVDGTKDSRATGDRQRHLPAGTESGE